ncbi:MAG: DUF72 domain-containing protein [Chloroflexota bacterium]
MGETTPTRSKYYVGTSGYHYDHWQQSFYPTRLRSHQWLDFYGHHFSTVELNNPFYRLPSESTYRNWRDITPADFLFAIKVSRLITHLKKLRNVEEQLKSFLQRARILSEKLGPLLYQLPPNMPRSPENEEALRAFLCRLPQDLQHVFEFRHQSWLEENTIQTLRQHNMGFCIMDMPSVQCPEVATTDFAYLRFHGSTSLYSSCYSEEELTGWARKIEELGKGVRATYIYFNNDAMAYAVVNAQRLKEILPRV